MPLPIVPLAAGLGSLLGAGFVGIVGFLAAIVGRKAAIALSLGTFLVAGWIAIQVAVYAAWVSLQWSMPEEMLIPIDLAQSLLPSNFAICIEVIIVSKIGRWLWDNQRDWATAVAMS